MLKLLLFFITLFYMYTKQNYIAVCANNYIQNYADSKILLFEKLYHDNKVTIYCKAKFNNNYKVYLPKGFIFNKYKDRAYRVEIEHIVPAENFGRSFSEWRLGGPQCIADGNPYKGRRCAQTNSEFRRMEADLHNLAPAIGAVNAVRKNARFGLLPDTPPTFGSCSMKVANNIAEPPDSAKGFVARTSLYMAHEYPRRYKLSQSQRQLFEAWDRMFPPNAWECERAQRIRRIQGNPNPITESRCR